MSKVSIKRNTLTAIADAIREKDGSTDLIAPGNMPEKIAAIQTGGGSGVELEKIDLHGKNCDYMFMNNCWDDFLTKYGTTLFEPNYDVASAQEMFCDSGLETIPFDVFVRGDRYFTNVPGTGSAEDGISMSNMYSWCINLIEQPKSRPIPYNVYETSTYIISINGMYSGCQKLKEIDIYTNWGWDIINKYVLSCKSMFRSCYSLRTIKGLSSINPVNPGDIYNYLFFECYVLDSIAMKSAQKETTTNMFVSTFKNCHRLKEMTLGNGTRKWSNQVIDLSSGIGYDNTGNCAKYLEDATKEIVGVSSYADYKNDPDCWTQNVAYSRYNKTSAAETLNSLPDTSAFGTNTIKFRGDSGSATDGGAINTLTSEEIAVAAAKGWTVSFT